MTIWAQSLSMLLGRRPDRMQVGALCRHGETGQVLLITSRDTGRWVIPKGWPMEGRSLCDAAAQEAWEEAGVTGRIHPQEIGRFRYDKRQPGGFDLPVDLRVFLLIVTTLSDDFPESHQRKRRWFDPRSAAQMVVEPGLRRILQSMPDHGPDHGPN